MMIQDLIPKFCNRIGLYFKVGLENHNTINMTSIDEERVGTFIQKEFFSCFCPCNFFGRVNEKHFPAFLRFITVFYIQFVFLFYHDHFCVFLLIRSSCIWWIHFIKRSSYHTLNMQCVYHKCYRIHSQLNAMYQLSTLFSTMYG